MLTVKQVLEGREFFYSARLVRYEAAHIADHSMDYVPGFLPEGRPFPCIFVVTERRTFGGSFTSEAIGLHEGIITILNDAGAQVKTYNLDSALAEV